MRRYRFLKHLTLPADLYSGPLGKPGDIVELPEERCALFGRFLGNRVRPDIGDLERLEDAVPVSSPAPDFTAPPSSATSTAPAARAAAAKE